MRTLPVRIEPLAVAVNFPPDRASVVVRLADGREISAPLTWFPRLEQANAEERNTYSFIGGGIGIRWPLIDEDLSVAGLLRAT
ncbi:MAG TPA: DUF2442 domain-containing protein [Bryobacteraceae bacterium]|nr:DUF2442 domain-containing protein [Bryobacteraceae bacterium]